MLIGLELVALKRNGGRVFTFVLKNLAHFLTGEVIIATTILPGMSGLSKKMPILAVIVLNLTTVEVLFK